MYTYTYTHTNPHTNAVAERQHSRPHTHIPRTHTHTHTHTLLTNSVAERQHSRHGIGHEDDGPLQRGVVSVGVGACGGVSACVGVGVGACVGVGVGVVRFRCLCGCMGSSFGRLVMCVSMSIGVGGSMRGIPPRHSFFFVVIVVATRFRTENDEVRQYNAQSPEWVQFVIRVVRVILVAVCVCVCERERESSERELRERELRENPKQVQFDRVLWW